MSKKIEIDQDAIKQLASLMEETGLTEIEVSEGETHIRVAKTQPAIHVGHGPAIGTAAPATASPQQTASGTAPPEGATLSPMVGTAYLAAEPGAAPFVKVGDKVAAGQTLMIIEAMKVMNPIKAEQPGIVSQILVTDAQPVEFGEVLMVIEQAA